MDLPPFHDTLEKIQACGLDPPEGAVGVIAAGGEDYPHLPQDELNQALIEVRGELDLGLSTTDSNEERTTSQLSAWRSAPRTVANDQNQGSSLDEGKNGGQTQGTEPISRESNGRFKPKVVRQHRRTKKINEYFEPVATTVNSREKLIYVCRQCSFEVTQQKQRERVFHLILCARVSILVRTGLYMTCFAKDKPPLLRYPLHHLTTANARKLVRTEHENMLSRLNFLQLAFDPTREPRYARYLLDVDHVKKSTPIGKCSSEEKAVATDLLLDFIIEENIPFALCDNKDSLPRPLRRLLSYLRPGYQLPSGYLVRTKLLDEYYAHLKKDVMAKLRVLLQECRGTIMFDGSEDINGAPMINVLLRVMGNSRISTSTYFLTTVYTGYDTVDATYYVKMTEKVMEEFGGFEYIAGVVTDNTGSVKNARETLERNYPRLVASQDQAHVADRLMADFGEIPWITEVHERLSKVSSILKRHRKLRAKMMETIKVHNNSLRLSETADNGGPTRDDTEANGETRHGDGEQLEGQSEEVGLYCVEFLRSTTELLEEEDCLTDEEIAEEGSTGAAMAENTVSQDTGTETSSMVPLGRRTAVTMKTPSAVRFASTEKLLEEYMRLRPVLLRLIVDPSFDKVYGGRTPLEIRKRESLFASVIRDESFLQRVKQVHDIFRACRTYLRIFDAETSIASEVFEATRIFKETLESLPLESFPQPSAERRQELLEIFENRRIGPLPGRKRIKIRLISDLHVAAALLDPYRSPVNATPHLDAFKRHLWRYLSGLVMEESEKEGFFKQIITQYFSVRARWIDKGILREMSETTTKGSAEERTSDRGKQRSCSPIVWWSTDWTLKPADPLERRAADELVEFAIRTLSVSPTATATERTFSLENRIHTKQRASLSKEKVRKILFCQWNSRVMRRAVQRDEIDIKWELERQMEGMRKLRSLRSAIISASKEASEATGQASAGTIHQVSSRDANRNEMNGLEFYNTRTEIVPTTCRTEVPKIPQRVFSFAGGSTVETQPVVLLEGEEVTAKNHAETRMVGTTRSGVQRCEEQGVNEELDNHTSLTHQPSKPSSTIVQVQENQQTIVSQLLRTAIQTTLEYGIQPQKISANLEVSDAGAQTTGFVHVMDSQNDNEADRQSRKRQKRDSK